MQSRLPLASLGQLRNLLGSLLFSGDDIEKKVKVLKVWLKKDEIDRVGTVTHDSEAARSNALKQAKEFFKQISKPEDVEFDDSGCIFLDAKE